MAETRFGTFEELMDITEEAMRPLAHEVRRVVQEVDPNAVEVVRLGDRAATYGVGPQKMKEGYAYIIPHKNWVNLGFYQGALLDDPKGLMEGTGKKLRHIKIRSVEEADKKEIRQLLDRALAERKQALGK